MAKSSYRDTLNLPRSAFPMKAELPKREPEWLERWQREGVYERLLSEREGRPRFVLHDGPPYANGAVHMGTALNKILKDFVVRLKALQGFQVPYVPGWDCHGMPIEHAVTSKLPNFRELPLLELRRRCREFADSNVDLMRDSFKRLGAVGRWQRPYLTMDYSYEAEIVAAFRELVAGGYVYKGLRPLRWCATCRTALAEAEVEYDEHRSPSIFVAFPMPQGLGEWVAEARGLEAAVVIWTTTPWTLPANLAVAFHPELDYVVVKVAGRAWLLAEARLEAVAAALGWQDWELLGKLPGRQLEGASARHPFLDRDSRFVLADYVTVEEGTGAVHTAPGHGAEDFETGRQYSLEVLNPVDEAGRFTDEAGVFAGEHVFAANPMVVELLRERDALLALEQLEHSYPHCWRCKDPLIYRATEQWFLGVEHENLRQRMLEQVEQVQWYPRWGEDRIRNMIAVRPDWCLSRQRSWGVPLPVFDCADCGKPLLDVDAMERVVELVRERGADVWFEEPPERFIPEGRRCEGCGGGRFERETNILDVWFDSSCSQRAVLEQESELAWPASLYLEGADQHRGWFQVSLITATATRGAAPYQGVLTHGLVLDGSGKKMSKLLGNVVPPSEVIERYGADILRLYFASVDTTTDILFSWDAFKPLVEAYRKLRNTCRFALGNLSDFDPGRDAVADPELRGVDRWALAEHARLSERVLQAYNGYEFHRAYHMLLNYATVELSATYFDLLKDRLYTTAADSPARRSAQTAVYRIVCGLSQLMSPLLVFTADEVWRALPGEQHQQSVHLSELPAPQQTPEAGELEDWRLIFKLRDQVSKQLEELRAAKTIGSSADARLRIACSGALAEALERHREELAEVFIVSEVELAEGAGSEPQLEVARAEGQKCQRCWKWTRDVGANQAHAEVCAVCAAVLERLEA